jgi:hypothetical protein
MTRAAAPGRTLLVALTTVATMLGSVAAHADPLPRRKSARAAALRQRGLEHFVNREFQLAADDLMAAYRIDKRQETLFGWAEAVRATGDCALATRIYQRLLDKTTELKLSRQAELGIAACANAIDVANANPPIEPVAADTLALATASEPDTVEVEEAHDEAPAAKPAPAPAPPPREPDHTASYLLIGGGAIAMLAGLVAYTGARDGTGDPNASHADKTSARSSGDWQRLIGASVAAAGGGVTVLGILRYRRDASRAREPVLALGPYVSTTGGGVVVSGGF